MGRLDLRTKILDMCVIMSGGNPGAMSAIMEILSHGEEIDPDAAMGGAGAILMLDTMEIYDERIYMLWNDVCNRNTAKLLAVLRAYQLGQLEGCALSAINYAIDHWGEGLDLDKICAAVQQALPNFNLEEN